MTAYTALLLCLTAAAPAEPIAPGVVPSGPAALVSEVAEKKDGPHRFSVEERFALRFGYTGAGARPGELQAPSALLLTALDVARVEATYRYKGWLKAVLEVDLAELPGLRPRYEWAADGQPVPPEEDGSYPLKDAFLRLGKRRFAVRGGHFKPPLSAVELDSSWDLAGARRGLLHDVLVEHMRFAGRRPGLELEWAPDWKLAPVLRAGAFQGSSTDGTLLRTVGVFETNLAARASLKPGPVETGVFASLVGTPPYPGAQVGRYWLVGVDAVTEVPAGPLNVRFWADGMYGLSFFGDAAQGEDAPFLAGRVLVAVRVGGREPGTRYAELFAQAETVAFDLTNSRRTLGGGVLGVNLGLWDRLRLTLQGEVREVGSASPLLSAGGNRLRPRRVFLAQLGGVLGQRWRF